MYEQLGNGSEFYLCFTLEDERRTQKVYAETRIPAGSYHLGLRQVGRLHEKYEKKFPEFHVGMIEIEDVPNFEAILIHIGNTEKDTAGCPLVGELPARYLLTRERFKIIESTSAYKRIYPLIAKRILNFDDVYLTIIDN